MSVISSNLESAKRLGRGVRARIVSDDLSDLAAESEIIFITTPDEAIKNVASKLAEREDLEFTSMIFLHTSGSLGSEALSSLQEKGGHVLSLHPIQLFPRTEPPKVLAARLRGIYFSIEGDPTAMLVARKIIRDVGGKVLMIRPDLKPLYHVACVLASNYFVALLGLLEEVHAKLGLRQKDFMEVFENLLKSTIEAVKVSSPLDALTGPIERGDVDTIKLHLAELRRALPDMVPFYTVMGMETIRLAAKKGTLTPQKTAHLIDAISSHIQRQVPSELLSLLPEHRN